MAQASKLSSHLSRHTETASSPDEDRNYFKRVLTADQSTYSAAVRYTGILVNYCRAVEVLFGGIFQCGALIYCREKRGSALHSKSLFKTKFDGKCEGKE